MKKVIFSLSLILSTSVFADYKIIMSAGNNIQIPEEGVSVSCKNILEEDSSLQDGFYTISPTQGGKFEVYCDMTTDGGGWTRITQDLARNNFGIVLDAQAGFSVWRDNLVFMGDYQDSEKSDGTMKISLPFGYQEFYLDNYYWADYDSPDTTGTFDVNNDQSNKPYQEIQLDSNVEGDITIGTDDNTVATMSFFAEAGVSSEEGTVFKFPSDGKVFNNNIVSQSLVIRALDNGSQDEDVFPWYSGYIYVR